MFRLNPSSCQAGLSIDPNMFLVEGTSRPVATQAIRSRYYAIGIPRLLELMREAGFANTARLDGAFYQPVLVGRKTA